MSVTDPRTRPARLRDPSYQPPTMGMNTVRAMQASALHGNLAVNLGVGAPQPSKGLAPIVVMRPGYRIMIGGRMIWSGDPKAIRFENGRVIWLGGGSLQTLDGNGLPKPGGLSLQPGSDISAYVLVNGKGIGRPSITSKVSKYRTLPPGVFELGDVALNDGPFQCAPGYGLYAGQCIPQTRVLSGPGTSMLYTVRLGNTAGSIARHYKVSLAALIAANPGKPVVRNDRGVYTLKVTPGEKLVIPGPGGVGDVCDPTDPDFNLAACADIQFGACPEGTTRDPNTGDCVLPQIQTGAAKASCEMSGGTWNGTSCVEKGAGGGGTKPGGGGGGGGSTAPTTTTAIASPGMSASTKKTLMIVGGLVAAAAAVGTGAFFYSKKNKKAAR